MTKYLYYDVRWRLQHDVKRENTTDIECGR